MSKDSFKNYFKYVQDVLGIKQIFIKHSEVVLPTTQLLITVLNLKTYTREEKSLLDKMITALQYDQKKIIVRDEAEVAEAFKFKLVLTDEVLALENLQENMVVTYSPRKLLQDPALKKITWSAMQSLIQKMNS